MMSLTGNNFVVCRALCVVRKTQDAKRKTHKGFTLIEIMVTTAILAFGIVMIYEAFFISLDSFNYCLNHLDAQLWLDEKIWQAQDSLRQNGILNPGQMRGEFMNRNKRFSWDMSYDLIEQLEKFNLYRLNLVISWQEGKRKINLLRSAYATFKEE